MNKTKIVISLILALVMLFSSFSVFSFADYEFK